MSIEKQNQINAQQRRVFRRAALKIWALISLKRQRAERQQQGLKQQRQHLERCYEASGDLRS